MVKIAQRDLLSELIADRRSPNTRRTYTKALVDFFMQVANAAPTPQLVGEFFALDHYQAMTLVLRYRRALSERGLAPSMINTRLAAIKSLVGYARKVGACHYDLADVAGVRVETYRDTSGVNPTKYQGMIGIFDRSTLKGVRDYAILRLLWCPPPNGIMSGECQGFRSQWAEVVDYWQGESSTSIDQSQSTVGTGDSSLVRIAGEM